MVVGEVCQYVGLVVVGEVAQCVGLVMVGEVAQCVGLGEVCQCVGLVVVGEVSVRLAGVVCTIPLIFVARSVRPAMSLMNPTN